ncbi:MAG: hypothetical protein ACM3MI_11050 [Clostridiales bacterium]
MVYIASNKILPTIKWNEAAPNFYIEELKSSDDAYKGIRKSLNNRYLYIAGAHLGCGCGFSYGKYELLNENDIEEDKKGRSSVKQLFQYIKDNLNTGESLELYTCWAGNEWNITEKKSEISIDQIDLGESFFFDDINELRIIMRPHRTLCK